MIAALTSRSAAALTRRILATFFASAVAVAWVGAAHADEPSDYCRRVTARAEGDAALLIAPTAHVQLIRYPNNGAADPSGFQIGHGVQPRAALSIGFVDIYKGIGVLGVAPAECRRQATAVTLEEVLAQRTDLGRLPALEQKRAYLESQSATVRDLLRQNEERFAAHTITLSEVQSLRASALSFSRKLATTEHEIALLKARGLPMPAAPLGDVLQDYESRTIEVENRTAHVRNLEPWKFGVIGGVAANPTVDAYGIAELSYNFGGLFSVGAERRGVEARARELKTARYEMRHQVETLERELRANAAQSRQEAEVLTQEIGRMARERSSLDETEAPNKHAVVASMTLSMIDLEAEQRFLTALAAAQAAIGGTK